MPNTISAADSQTPKKPAVTFDTSHDISQKSSTTDVNSYFESSAQSATDGYLQDSVETSIADKFDQATEVLSYTADNLSTNINFDDAAQKTSGDDKPSLKEVMDDPGKLVDLYDNNPEAFNDFYKELSSDDRKSLMTRLNRQMQKENEMTTLLSNLLQAAHRTTSALIQNIRV